MRADLFYAVTGTRPIPLYLLSQNQWEEHQGTLSAAERHYFEQIEFKGKLGEYVVLPNSDGFLDKAYIGTGDGNHVLAMANAALLLPANTYQVAETLSQEAVLFWALAQYRFEHYKKSEVQARILIVNPNALSDLIHLVEAHFLVRDLINQPTSDMGPKEMAHVVEQLAQTHNAQLEQWIGDELIQANFPAIYTVGRAAQSEPRLLSLTWGNEVNPRVTLVGKGVCFDTGGLNLKSADSMRTMKKDMGGAAHAIGLAHWIMARNLPVRLHMLIPAVENAIGSNAYRPGDVLTMRNGFTVEIDNTDAEGRLVMADALVKACEGQPDLLIDFATLTGAARVSVGTEMSAFFSNNEHLATGVMDAAEHTADPVWRLPLFGPYERFLNSNIADMVNCCNYPYAGAIVAALFLQRYITKALPWVHFDIMAWSEQSKPGKPQGGEAMGLRAMAKYLLDVYGRTNS